MASEHWFIYDTLIEAIPDSLFVRECIIGIHWVAVISEGVGLAMTLLDNKRSLAISGTITGSKLKDIAKLAKSWNNLEASLGIAAINSYYNSPSVLNSTWGEYARHDSNDNVFDEMRSELGGRKVAVIGHFPALESIAEISKLSILERNPLDGDYPDPACEYILEEQDYVFITGVTFTNKTLPRLLELSKKAKCVLVGPSVPLSPVLFSMGVYVLAGTVVCDEMTVLRNIRECCDRSIFKHGARMIRFRNKEMGRI